MIGQPEDVVAPAGIFTLVAVNISCLFWYRRFLGTTRGNAMRLWLAAFATAGAVFAWHATRPGSAIHFGREQMSQTLEGIAALASTSCLVFFAVPFIAKLYFKWVGGLVTEQEKSPGPDGLRAWLEAGNVICALLISVCAWLGYGYSFWGIFAVCIAGLLAYPAVGFAFHSAPAGEPAKEEQSPEREKILKLLAEGKISAEESTALLNALAPAAKSRAYAASPVAPAHKLVLLGAVLVLIGFFLPWFSYNLGHEMGRQFQHAMGDIAQQFPGTDFGGSLQPPAELKTGSFSMNGGDIPKGLGWLVLCLGIAAAALPHFAAAMCAHTRRLVTFALLGAGALIAIYLLTQSFRFASVGIILVLAGFALELLGTLKEQQAARIAA